MGEAFFGNVRLSYWLSVQATPFSINIRNNRLFLSPLDRIATNHSVCSLCVVNEIAIVNSGFFRQ